MKSLYRKVDSFDGQTITINGKPSYELGSFLGGGAAGVVYEVCNRPVVFLCNQGAKSRHVKGLSF